MPEIIFPQHTTSADALFAHDQEAIEAFLKANENRGTLFPNTPYCLPGQCAEQGAVLGTLRQIPQPNRTPLMRALDDFGDDIVSLAEFYDRNLLNLDLQQTASLAGAAATAKGTRLNGFQEAMVHYQKALLELHKHNRVGRVGTPQKRALEHTVRQRYATLQNQYKLELRKIIPAQAIGKNRGNALTSVERGLTLAQRKGTRKLNVSDTRHAQHLKSLAAGIRWSGNGMLLLDAGIRVNGVRNTYQHGGNWQREMVKQTTGFGTGGAVGILIGKGMIGWLTAIGLGLTPLGWVVMIGIGVTAGFAAGYFADQAGQGVAGIVYDRSW